MDFSLLYQLKNSQPQIARAMFNLAMALASVTLLSYGIFSLKTYLQKQDIAEIDQALQKYGTADQREAEQKVLDYKRQIDDFQTVLKNHKIITSVFTLIESHTLPDVWFSSFSVDQEDGQIRLSGEARDMDTLSRQMDIFEASNDYIAAVGLQGSETTSEGGVKFMASLSLNPAIFISYQEPLALPTSQPSPTPSGSAVPGNQTPT